MAKVETALSTDGITIGDFKVAEALENLFDSSRLKHLVDLEDAFDTDNDALPYDREDPENDRTITRDEFVALTTKNKQLDASSADKIFDAIRRRFGADDRLTSDEVVPFWKMIVEGEDSEVPEELNSKIRRLTAGSLIKIAKEDLVVPGIGKVGDVVIYRRSVPKGLKLPGMGAHDGDSGAWRTVHRLFAVMNLDPTKFNVTKKELALLVSKVDIYGVVLELSASGKKLNPADCKTDAQRAIFAKAKCSNIYYSTFDATLGDGYDVICMEPPRQSQLDDDAATAEMEWWTHKLTDQGEAVELNQLAPTDHPTFEGHTWGRWGFNNKIQINYETLLDMPKLPGGNAGTGSAGMGILDAGAKFGISKATLSLLRDTVKMGIVFSKIKIYLAEKGAPSDFDSALGALTSFYKPVKGKDLEEILKIMPSRIDAHLKVKVAKNNPQL